MKKYFHSVLVFLITIVFCTLSQMGFAQKNESAADSIRKAAIHDSLAIKAMSDTVVPKIVNKIETYTFTISRSSSFFRHRIDTSKISTALPGIEKGLTFFKNRLDKSDVEMNLRNLNTFSIMLQESADKLAVWQQNLNDYSEQLIKSNLEIKRIINDATLKTSLPDTALIRQAQSVLKKAHALDSIQQLAITRINVMKNKVSISSLLTSDMLSDLRFRTISFKTAMWGQEESPLFRIKTSEYKQSLLDVFTNSFQRSFRVFSIYTAGSWNIRSLNLLLLATLLAWCLINYKRIKKYEDADKIISHLHFLNHSVIISCLTVFLCVAPFFYSNPPMVYMHVNELVRLACITYLLLPFLSRQAKTNWLIMSVLWVIFAMDDLLLESAFGERFVLLLGSMALLSVSIKMLRDKGNMFIKLEEPPAKRAITILTLSFAALSIIFNITGRITLAKIFSITAIQSFIFTFTLRTFSTIILEAVYLQSESFRESRFSDFINYDDLKTKLRKILWLITGILWIIAFSRSLTMYDMLMKMLDSFFNTPRSIGNMQFTFMSVAIFAFVIWISSVISQFINFFFGSKLKSNTNKRSNIGSVMLLVRLAIWALGFLIAIAAAGIPLDKISIMIGALGVGIGFGLQNIVNNLVSGIILAFERPIQVGDTIEIDSKAGVVKEIGVRSSKISNSDGADIIVPNGDLLSKQLVNWTLHNRNKRLEFSIGVAYEADVYKAKEVIEQVLKSDANVMKTPAPSVSLINFGASSVDFKISFWTYNLDNGGSLRSNIMMAIFTALNKAGIEIPYPKQDVYIKSVKGMDNQ